MSMGSNNNNNSIYRPSSIASLGMMKQSLVTSPHLRNNLLVMSKQSIPANKSNILKSTKFSNNRLSEKPLSTQLSLELKPTDMYNFFSGPNPNTISRVLEEKNVNNIREEFIPCDVKFMNGQKPYIAHSSQSLLNVSPEVGNQSA